MAPPRASRRHAARPARSNAEWAARGALALVAAGLAWISVSHSLALILKDKVPAHAHALAPWDGQITARLAGQRFVETQEGGIDSQTAQLARQALRQDPMAISALSTLGLQAQLRQDIAAARRLFAYSQRLSRRDLQTQLWAIEDSVARGDIPAVLSHYDIALRTSRNAPDLLFPVLGSAIEDQAIRTSLARMLLTRPAWSLAFVSYAAESSVDANATASLLASLVRGGYRVPDAAVAQTIDKLISAGAIDAAWRFYQVARGAVDRRRSRDPRFESEFTTPSVFDWQTPDTVGVSSSIQRGQRGGMVEFGAPPSVGGPVLQQRQFLPPGRYRLSGRSVAIDQNVSALPFWTLVCANGRSLGRVVVPPSPNRGGTFEGIFSVPADCPSQTLSLVLQPSDDIAGVSGRIERAQLEPL
ncbi:MAG TPA: hypothetical protein DEP91_06630 [Sphingomonas bacterium]|jgi:hypothetical protein|uniref:Uncharacterized protein n=1 Tax=Sphingomonas bacterium TaxID=1895847 RepID=A0A3D0WAS2_9SPHN|nr:hypothetical protein [Sphingomonas bacterium]